MLMLTLLLSSQEEGGGEKADTMHQRLRPLVCVMTNRTLDSRGLGGNKEESDERLWHFDLVYSLK